MAKTQSTFETPTATPAFPDFAKIDFTKIQADFGKWFGDYTKTFANGKAGLFDFEGVVAAQKKNFEVLTAANQAAFEGVKAVAQRQAEIARKAVEEFGKVAKELAEPTSAEEKFVKQAELTKAGFEQAVANVRELTDLVQKSNTEVASLIQSRFVDQIEEVKAAVAKVAPSHARTASAGTIRPRSPSATTRIASRCASTASGAGVIPGTARRAS